MKKDGVVYSLGNTDPLGIYDLASILGIVQDSICYDSTSEFARVLCDLVNSAYSSLPNKFTVSFGDRE